jgi:hypothetical protein
MKNDVSELFRILSGLWLEYAKKKDFETVMEVSFASRLLFKALPNAEGAHESSLGALHQAIEVLLDEGQPPVKPTTTDARECSFCGRKPPEVRLGAGPNVFICDNCVGVFSEVFRQGEK